MPTTAARREHDRPAVAVASTGLWPLTVAAGLLILHALTAPRLVFVTTAGLAIVAMLAAAASGSVERLGGEVRDLWRAERSLWLATIGLTAYLAITLLWAPAPASGAGKVLLLLGLAGLAVITAAACRLATAATLGALGRAMLIGLGVGVAFLLVEELFNHPIKSAVFNIIPALRPDARHIQTSGDLVEGVAAYLSNRNVAVLVLLLWPGLALVGAVFDRGTARIVSVPFGVATALTVVLSVHASSRLALIGGIGMYATARLLPRAGFWAAAVTWLALTLLVVPVALGLYARDLHLNERVPYSFRARIVLWNYTANQIIMQPLVGVGIDGTKPLDGARKRNWEQLPGHVYPQRTGEHAHNFYLQFWYELGAVGVGLVTLFGIFMLRAVSRLSLTVRPLGYAAFVTAALLGATSWGVWQPWLMGAYGVSLLIMLIALATGRDTAGDRRVPEAAVSTA